MSEQAGERRMQRPTARAQQYVWIQSIKAKCCSNVCKRFVCILEIFFQFQRPESRIGRGLQYWRKKSRKNSFVESSRARGLQECYNAITL